MQKLITKSLVFILVLYIIQSTLSFAGSNGTKHSFLPVVHFDNKNIVLRFAALSDTHSPQISNWILLPCYFIIFF
jgi:CHASE3 domain sensor protein